jgi:diguanylate cyclase (GGDEF)-like protein
MQGILVVGRALTLPELNNISESIHLPIDIQDTSSQKMKSDFTQALQNLRETNQTKYINPLNEEWISGYTLLRDHDNQPGLILRIMEKREFYNHAKSFNLYFISAVILIGLFFGIGINLLIDRNIIRRLDVINQAMDQVRQQKDLSTRIYLPGNDEIASLAHKINLTFAALQYSNQALLDNEARLSQTSRHDGLTNLPNRVALIDRLNKVGELNSSNHLAAVLLIDLDRFKLINDSFDHQAGDKVLVETARRIASCLPDNAFLARPGGDEFVVVLNELKSQREASDAAKTILNVISTPYEIQDRNIFLSASIGIATTQSAQQVDDLLRNADLAMYHAKSRGKGRFEIFTNAMHATSLGLLQMENDLRRGIEQEEFILHYQPIIRLDTGRIDMVEVLVRWQHPTSGLLYPGEFLPVAEDTGLIVPLNEWVMISAARQLLDWHDMGYTFLNLAVNVPAQQLQDPSFKSFIEKYEPQLAEKAFSVQVEITENTAMADFDLAINYLAYMRDRGVRIAIDDFGTGYSSLAYLQRFPVDCVKIDRSFLEDYQSNATLLEAIIAMGHALGLEVTAEGVETYDQLKFLSRLGCDKAQGFLFCRPVSPEVIGEILAQHPQGDFVKNIPTNSWGKQT